MDLEKALQFLFTKAIEGAQRKTFRPEAEPKHVYFMSHGPGGDGDGVPTRIEALAGPIDASFKSIDSLACFVGTEGGEYSAVWYSTDRIVAVLDHAKDPHIAETDEDGEVLAPSNDLDDRRERGTIQIQRSDQILKLLELNDSKRFKQRDLVFMLRTVFIDCLGQAGDIVALLRSIKFDVAKASVGEVGRHNTGSIGKSLRTEISNVDKIPDMVTLDVPYFAGALLPPSLNVRVRMVLEADPESETFQFFPLPGEMAFAACSAEANLLAEIKRRLEDHGAKPRIYHGTPEK